MTLTPERIAELRAMEASEGPMAVAFEGKISVRYARLLRAALPELLDIAEQIAESCRHWAAQMHRASSAFEAESDGSMQFAAVIDGNRAVAETLAQAAEAVAKLDRIAAILEPLRALEAAAWTNRTIEAAARNALPALLREIQETP